MSNENDRYITVINLTEFFKRAIIIYSLGDIKFSKPIARKKLAYIVAFYAIWALPLILIFGIPFNIYFVALVLVPPLVIGNYAAKPVWGGRGLMDYLKVTAKFISEPKGWTDLNPSKNLDRDTYFVDHRTWVSRRREYTYLANLKEKEEAAKAASVIGFTQKESTPVSEEKAA